MDYLESQELLLYAIGKNEEEVEELLNDYADMDVICYESFNIDFEQFIWVAEALLTLTPVVKSPLTGNFYHMFANQKGDHMIAIVKQEFKK